MILGDPPPSWPYLGKQGGVSRGPGQNFFGPHFGPFSPCKIAILGSKIAKFSACGGLPPLSIADDPLFSGTLIETFKGSCFEPFPP